MSLGKQNVTTAQARIPDHAEPTSVKLLRDGGMGIKEIYKRLEIGVGSVYAAIVTTPNS